VYPLCRAGSRLGGSRRVIARHGGYTDVELSGFAGDGASLQGKVMWFPRPCVSAARRGTRLGAIGAEAMPEYGPIFPGGQNVK